MVTVEAAFAIATIVAVVIVGIGAIVGITTHIRSIDAAREAARIAAQGDSQAGMKAGRAVGGNGMHIDLHVAGDEVTARVHSSSALLPGIDLGANAVAAMEPQANESL